MDPYRVDDIDIYSNILFVSDNSLKLSRVAHDFLDSDKDRPEVCCLVGKLSNNLTICELTSICRQLLLSPRTA